MRFTKELKHFTISDMFINLNKFYNPPYTGCSRLIPGQPFLIANLHI